MFQTRAISSIGVVAAGIIPAIIGGPLFSLVWAVLYTFAYHEFRTIMGLRLSAPISLGYLLVFVATFAGADEYTDVALPWIVGLSIGLPLILGIFMHGQGVIEHVALSSFGTLLFAIPAFATTAIRNMSYGDRNSWTNDLGSWISDDTGRGLSWLLLALLVTWLADTAAYLVGRQYGRTKLFPRISPNKTVEGAAAGLGAAILTAIIFNWLFGLDYNFFQALLIGLLLGAVGMLGDLSQSMIKRQRGVKDSGTLIPGHGGIYDRIDALMFAVVTSWIIATWI